MSSEHEAVEQYRLRGNIEIDVFNRTVNVSRLLKLGGLALALLAPVLLIDFYVSLLTRAFVLVVFALGVDLIWGYSGVMTFGHAAFFGMGAYVTALLIMSSPFGPGTIYLALVLAVVLPVVVGLFVGYVLFSLEMEPMNFTMITLAIAIMAEQLAISWRSVTGGYSGLFGIPPLEVGVPGTWVVLDGVALYYLVTVLILVAYLLAQEVVHSPFGTTLVAIRENEERAKALGYSTVNYKTFVFAIGCGYAGFAGALYAPVVGFIDPSVLGFLLSANVVLWILVGGRGTLVGAVVGVTFLTFLQETLSSAFEFSWSLILGFVFVVIVLLFPEGIVGLAERTGVNRYIRQREEQS